MYHCGHVKMKKYVPIAEAMNTHDSLFPEKVQPPSHQNQLNSVDSCAPADAHISNTPTPISYISACSQKYDNDNTYWLEMLKKSDCKICFGFNICNKHSIDEIPIEIFTLSTDKNGLHNLPKKHSINSFCKNNLSHIELTEFIVKYTKPDMCHNTFESILKEDCKKCKIERDEVTKNNTKCIKYSCRHNNDADNCMECFNLCQINNGYCKHNRKGYQQIVYCKLCNKDRYRRIYKKDKDCTSETHSSSDIYCKCYIAICKHNIVWDEECVECKKDYIVGNKCIHNKCSDCEGCVHLCKYWKRNMCIHNEYINECIECGIVKLCFHNKIWYKCSMCNLSSSSKYCFHDKPIDLCRIHGGSKLCKSGFCDNIMNPQYDNYCLRCFVHLFPDNSKTHNYKTKEKNVTDNILKKFKEFTWICDKKVQEGCSKRRPDLLLDLATHIIIVEVDENQHNLYDSSCENKRLMELSQDLQHRPIVFIRFNPDEYTIDKKTIETCWGTNKSGLMIIKKKHEKQWIERLETLYQHIQHWIENISEKHIEIIKLYYSS
jgi:hypothetical protein